MRLVSLLGITAATIFAALTCFSPSASACGDSKDAEPIPPIKDQLIAFREYSSLFTIYPHFGLLQPEGTQAVYKNDTQGRVRGVNFVNANGAAIIKALFEYRPVYNPRNSRHPEDGQYDVPHYKQIQYAFIKAYSEDGGRMTDYAYIQFNYGGEDYIPLYEDLDVTTPRGTAHAGHPSLMLGGCVTVSKEEMSLAYSIAFPGEERIDEMIDGTIVLELPGQPRREIWLALESNNDKVSIMPASKINNL
ncbi:hypothetical protein THASP1DRAFT_32912 [Thamnocephalis sphaerospora]|uniref:Uncharacterized protein n=1 Tax=Thamnocephalis sphaerospora TaxID=78915 RepID=A0A4P9XHU8_9FUNG|nr:hypothetical protein THASP1DRAFT_32912 [Thamnocephalis sphaerospora]|eukprot:RKP05248.1 hypothetical protein THASP1DRAFT_32912 [Thamnocephalis sphaerospora]